MGYTNIIKGGSLSRRKGIPLMAKSNSSLVTYNVRDLTRTQAYAKSPTVGKLWDAMQEKDAKAAADKAKLS